MPPNLAQSVVMRGADQLPLPPAIVRITDAEIELLQLSPLAKSGLWPGIRRPPTVDGRGDETASASREPWVDANGYLVGCLRALYPDRPPVLAHLPDKLGDRAVPYDSLELALIEAWTAGGNYILTVEPHYREALQRKDPKAMAAWAQLGRTAQWLQSNLPLFRQRPIPQVTALVEPGAATAEIANLLYRRNVSPALAPLTAIPAPDPARRAALVAVNLKSASSETKRILAHAEAGGTVVAAASASQQWWKVAGLKQLRTEKDRDFYALGKGQLVAYRRLIADPSEFALDVIDLITHKKRTLRLWNAPAVIGLATDSPRKGERLLHLINYGSPIDMELQARVQGHYAKAVLLRPDADAIPLQPANRGSMTEVQVPDLSRLGVVVFS